MLLMVREMLRSIASPSYVSRASVTVCRHEEEQRGQDASIGLNFEGQKSLEEPPGLVEQLLDVDEQVTLKIGLCARPATPHQRLLKVGCMCLELSGHGVPWFLLSGLLLILYYLTGKDVCFTYGLNLFTILVMDIFIVAPIKLFFKRPRPSVNSGKIPLSVSSVDGYAFPSGHASRCVALAAYFCYMPPFYLRTHLWYIWAIVVSLSRVVLGRHHMSDVGAGIVAGLLIFETVRRLGLLYGV